MTRRLDANEILYRRPDFTLARAANGRISGTRLELTARSWNGRGAGFIVIRDDVVADRLAAELEAWARRRRRELRGDFS